MDDAAPETRRTPEQPSRRGHVLTPRRIAAVVAVALRRPPQTARRFAQEVFRHRRRLKLAFTVLVLLRPLLDRHVAGVLGIVAALLLDEVLGLFAADAHLKRVAEREAGREGVVETHRATGSGERTLVQTGGDVCGRGV